MGKRTVLAHCLQGEEELKKTLKQYKENGLIAGGDSGAKAAGAEAAGCSIASTMPASIKKEPMTEDPPTTMNSTPTSMVETEKPIKKEIVDAAAPVSTAIVAAATPVDGSNPEPSASSSSASGSGGGEQVANTTEAGESKDLTQNFLPVNDIDIKETTCTKDLFLATDLVCPGIAVKKAKLAFDSAGPNVRDWLVIAGEGTIKMHKKDKRCLESMFMGNAVEGGCDFWTALGKHLNNRKVAAVMVASTSTISLEQVLQLCKLFLFK